AYGLISSRNLPCRRITLLCGEPGWRDPSCSPSKTSRSIRPKAASVITRMCSTRKKSMVHLSRQASRHRHLQRKRASIGLPERSKPLAVLSHRFCTPDTLSSAHSTTQRCGLSKEGRHGPSLLSDDRNRI